MPYDPDKCSIATYFTTFPGIAAEVNGIHSSDEPLHDPNNRQGQWLNLIGNTGWKR
jgi:hypothetical protein